jgi:hypothetical protein
VQATRTFDAGLAVSAASPFVVLDMSWTCLDVLAVRTDMEC